MLQCFHCGSALDATMTECAACGAEVEMSRLTGILGTVCRTCDAFNEPGTVSCVSCGQPLGRGPAPVLAPPPPHPEEAPPPSPHELPPIDFEAVMVDAPEAETGGAVAGDLLPRPPELLPTAPELAAPDLLELEPYAPGDASVASAPIDLVEPVPSAAPVAPPPLPFEAVTLEPEPLPGAPEAPAAPLATLVVDRGDGREGATFPVGDTEVAVGRSECTVSFPGDPSLAPRHATFLVRSGRLVVRDEGAAGGTYLRLRGLTVPLRPGDAFAVGDRLLRFGGPLPAAAPPAPDGTRKIGSPRPHGHAVLVEERLAGGTTGRVWLRSGPSVTLGRAGCAVNLGDDPFLSQAHAEIVLEADGTARLRDLGSANGTFVRLPPRAERELQDGDLVRVGRQVLRVSFPAPPEARAWPSSS